MDGRKIPQQIVIEVGEAFKKILKEVFLPAPWSFVSYVCICFLFWIGLLLINLLYNVD